MHKLELSPLVEGKKLSELEAQEMMDQVMKGNISSQQLAGFLSILRFRGETVEEMLGFSKAMREHMTKISYEEPVVDTCGTGGDGLSTFNISTAVAITMASMGVKVAKHGNRKVSSSSGSADVLELLGIPVDSTPEQARQMLVEQGMTFLFAPNYHQAMKHAAKARLELGFRTFFNLLGPLSNPANAKHQVIGIFDTALAEKLAETLRSLGSKHVLLVTGREGLDEISITEETDIVELKDGEIKRYTLSPEDVSLPRGVLADIQVQHATESAVLIRQLFKGEANESATNIVLFNAGAGLYVAGKVSSIRQGVEQVKIALDSGVVQNYFESIGSDKVDVGYA